MAKLKVAVTDYIEPNLDWEAEEMRKRGFEFVFHQLKFEPVEKVIAATRDADAVVVNMVKVTAELIAGWEKCRLVIRHGVGYDNVDVAALDAAGIPLCYIPDYCVEEVAEQAIAMMLACNRKLFPSRKVLEDSSKAGIWDFQPVIPIRRLAGQTIGILGCGRIGSRVFEKLQSFGVRFLICDPYLTAERKRELGIEVVDKERLFRESDIVTIHTPLTAETRHIVNAAALATMKPGACLVNTARGPMVDAEALAAALSNQTIASAAIDVFDVEPPPPSYPLFGLPNVILTPHLAWYSEDGAWRIRELIVHEIDRFAQGLPPRYRGRPAG